MKCHAVIKLLCMEDGIATGGSDGGKFAALKSGEVADQPVYCTYN